MNPRVPVAWNACGESIGALLSNRAADHGEAVFLHLLDDRSQEEPVSYAALLAGAKGVAAALQKRGVRPGDRVMGGLPTGLAFLELFFGTLLMGATIVPFYPPTRAKGLEEYQRNLAGMVKRVAPALVITFPRARLAIESAVFQAGSAAPVLMSEALKAQAETYVADTVPSSSTALIQFTSGSTRAPKGVVLTHRAILENLAAIAAMVRARPGEVVVSWLPLYHDMGLLGMMVLPLFLDLRLVLLSPQSFLLDAKRWLWAIHRHRAAISTAPNFAYQLIVNRLKDSELEGLDLACWRLAYNGAEPVIAATHAAFATRLAPYGFDPGAFRPIYGLAELAVGAAFPEPDRPPRLDWVAATRMAEQGVAEPVEPQAGGATYLSVGAPLPGYTVRIMGRADEVLPERRVGEIQICGPSLMTGYLDDPAETARAIVDGWLATGDLGYMADGELFLVGRLKDMIIKAGRNFAPHDLEGLAAEVAGVRVGCVVAFGVPDEHLGTSAVVVLAETREDPACYPALARAIGLAIAGGLGLSPDRVELVPPGFLPKTTSGKLQRAKARDLWLAGQLAAAQPPGLPSMIRIVGQAMVQRVTNGRQKGTRS